MNRKKFLLQSSVLTAGFAMPAIARSGFSEQAVFPTVRVSKSERRFSSKSVDAAIKTVGKNIDNPELAWLFNNCFPNTLDTTVTFEMIDGKPDTYVITGDIDAMWLRDSTAQVWPYLAFIHEDAPLRQLIAGVINRQASNILFDPYANAFYRDRGKESEWKNDHTDMKPGIHERKWEIDSLCYPVRLAHGYWKKTGDVSIFDAKWKEAAQLIIKTFRQQQRKHNAGPYHFERSTAWATDGVPLGGYGYPAKSVGLIYSMFRPSDDATIFPFLIPSNYFANTSIRQLASIVSEVYKDTAFAAECTKLADEVAAALKQYSVVHQKQYGNVLAYEVNGFGSFNIMDDANVPSLLSLPYLGAMKASDPLYISTRKLLLSDSNPFFFSGKAGEGIGGPHAGMNMIWPLSIIMRGLTSTNGPELRKCIQVLQRSNAGTGFMHESFHKDDAAKFTRKWFAWANTLFGELIWETFEKDKGLLTK